ncbi:TPA: sensor histidine kinase [Clostridium botulinum]|uniref:sensor histidine kinase n=1 Tax=Clostridium botulinum TaxID=1491 RepID=UPI000772DC3E|nr:HAMP domain-containing sensor histidine kinase [Clostridium botulinum]APC81728.1 his Kinase A domain protein [Clostridium botulinum]APQ99901.1 his Kinase A domain protein [Clostridium botulinum]APU59849.1 his Kinase A domain protein [Clostridium botulinum]AUN02565.1 sensor histidine kinase [Clostridium botulinum]MBN3398641.1 sensor histidine kinase [Clostridium botulinum]
MKKILKLRGEMVTIAILSVIIASVSVIFINNLTNMFTKGQHHNYIKENKNNKINHIIDEYKKRNIDDRELVDIINKWNETYYNVYLVDSNGNVIASREKGIKNINLKEVKDKAVRKLEGKNVFETSGIINVDYKKSIVYYSTYYANDFHNAVYILILTVILFIILTGGRIVYIGEINKGITIIANGDFKKRINIKYKNELSELAESINIMASRLEEEDYKKREFITNISHDLRTPLTTILGYTKMIEESKYENVEELNRYIDMINKKGIYLKSLLDDFFTYSKLNSNDIKVKYSNIDCNLFLQQIIEEEKINFMEKNLNLELLGIKDKVYINADGELMVRAIYNLLSNALKYSKEKTEVRVIMDEEIYHKKSYVTISVINTPKEKINEKEVHKLFERLYKREEGRNSEGNGLGLTITKKIMKLNDGFIKVQVMGDEVKFKLGFPKNKI